MKKLLTNVTFAAISLCVSQSLLASNSAIHCVSIERADNGAVKIANNCGFSVEAFWCVENLDCKNGRWGMTNSWTIRSGGSYPVSGGNGRNVFAFACDKPNSSIIEQGPNQFGCKE